MRSIELWTEDSTIQLDSDQLNQLLDKARSDLRIPFAEESLSALELFSKRLLTDTFSRQSPQLVALGYWLRKAAISRLRERVETGRTPAAVMVPRGLAFHLPPANVDTLFIYSWALSFLAGNCNVVRVPTAPSEVAGWCLRELLKVLKQFDLDRTQAFCSFDHSSDVGRDISAKCDLRVIWGGDEKVLSVSKFPVKPDGLSIGFSDRKSMCVIKTVSYQNTSEAEKINLAEKFYNDIFWFDQLGCGSPRAVIWVGSEEPPSDLFYQHLTEIIGKKHYRVEPHIDMSKLVFTNELVGTGVASHAFRKSPELTVLDGDVHTSCLEYVHGGGVLFQMKMDDLRSMEQLVRPDLQTLTMAGFSEVEKIELARLLNGRGGYRIVPVGSALEFDSIWDGIDLMSHFSRQITVR